MEKQYKISNEEINRAILLGLLTEGKISSCEEDETYSIRFFYKPAVLDYSSEGPRGVARINIDYAIIGIEKDMARQIEAQVVRIIKKEKRIGGALSARSRG